MGYAPNGSFVLTPETLTNAPGSNDGAAPAPAPAPAAPAQHAAPVTHTAPVHVNVQPAPAPVAPTAQAPAANPAPAADPLQIGGTSSESAELQALRDQNARLETFTAVGGEDAFNKMSAWAETGLDTATKDALNIALRGGTDPKVRNLLLGQMKTAYDAAHGIQSGAAVNVAPTGFVPPQIGQPAAAVQPNAYMQGTPGVQQHVGVAPITESQWDMEYQALRAAGKRPDSLEVRALDARLMAGYQAGTAQGR